MDRVRMLNKKEWHIFFTIVTIFVIIFLYGGVCIIPYLIRSSHMSTYRATETTIGMLETALENFKSDTERYPSSKEGLLALRQKPGNITEWNGPYLPKDIPNDPWGNAYIYKHSGVIHSTYDIYSTGKDGISNSNGNDIDDINNWDTSKKWVSYYSELSAKREKDRNLFQSVLCIGFPLLFVYLWIRFIKKKMR